MSNGLRRMQDARWFCVPVIAAWLVIQSQAAPAQPRPEPLTGVGIDYGDPKLDANKRVRDRLMNRKGGGALEQYREFMSPLKLTRRLTVRMKECGGVDAHYSSADSSITFCYELLT